MVNRIFVLFLALAAVGSSAFASRASNIVLGTGDAGTILNGGSFFYDDNYNMFYNPAYINDFKNFAIIEKSNFPGTTAQGGFVSSWGNWNVGAYFNRGNAVVTTPGLATAAGGFVGNISNTNAYGAATPNRPIDLMAGTDLGMMKIGLGLTYASNNNGTLQTSYLAGTLGAEIMGLDPFLTYNFMTGDSGPSTDSHTYIRGGARYHFGEWTPYFAVSYASDTTVVLPTAAYKELNIGGGIGRSTRVSDGVRMNYALSYWAVNDTLAPGLTVGSSTPTRIILPIDFSLEGDAMSWLTLRGGVGFHLIDRTNTANTADNATGRIGATAHVGKVDVEWALGRSFNPASNQESSASPIGSTTTPPGTVATNLPYDAQGVDIGAQFFSALNVAYHW